MAEDDSNGLHEIAIVGDIGDHESEITDKLLQVPPGGDCVLYFDSPGGSPYSGMAILSLIRLRGMRATGIVTGECSSAALWPLAACERRIVTPYSVLLFHTMKWQSDERVGLAEAAEWARHFGTLEGDMDRLLAEMLRASPEKISEWMQSGKYVSGPEFAEAGFGELITLDQLAAEFTPALPKRRRAREKARPRKS